MATEAPSSREFARYLRVLGVAAKPPSAEALAEITSAQVRTVPFENVSKLYYRETENLRDLPGFARFLDGIEGYHFGGTCYAANYYLHLLLAHLGYDVRLCGADMSNPDVHVVNIVAVSGREFLVDAGNAAPFFQPLPRDLSEDFVVALGRDRYVLRPRDGEGRSRVDLHRDAQLVHGYLAKPTPRSIDFFREVIVDSFTDDSTFMNALLIVRFFEDRSVVLHNLDIIRSRGPEFVIETLAGREEIPRVVEREFGMPREIVAAAIRGLGEFRSAWS
jgi:arylamine N-acetyltransferase